MQPKTDAFREILEQVKQPTTANFLQLLSTAAEYLESGETIAEIGCLGGANLIGILREHGDRLAYGVDFFSTEDETGFGQIKVKEDWLNF
jgi:protein O-GlcNAc transferase